MSMLETNELNFDEDKGFVKKSTSYFWKEIGKSLNQGYQFQITE